MQAVTQGTLLRQHVQATLAIAMTAGLSMTPASVVLAQQASANNAERAPLEEIFVTAQRRTEPLQDVPIAISAISSEALEKLNASGFADYVDFVPGLAFQDRGPGQNRFAIRGVSAPVSTSAATVGIYLDELPISDLLNTPDVDLYDIHSVEVLRGPQGTLYGEGSMGGTIRLLTNRPDTKAFAASGEGDLGSVKDGGTSWGVRGMANLPAGEKFAARLVGFSRENSGWVNNVAPTAAEKDVNDEKTSGGRLALLFQPIEALSILLTGIHQDTKLGGFNLENVNLPDRQQSHANAEDRSDKFTIGNLDINYDFGPTTLTSSTSYLDRDLDETRDIGTFGFLPTSTVQVTTDAYKTFTQELRLASSAEGSWRWLVGGFYRDSQLDEDAVIPIPGFSPPPVKIEVTQAAVFGDVTYEFNDAWQASFGLRWTSEDQDLENVGSPLGGASSSNSDVTPRLTVSWKPDADFLYYATAAKGFRSGGVNRYFQLPELFGLPPGAKTYDPDYTWNYELGAKTQWADGRVILNGAAYYIDWKDVQSFQSFGVGFGIFNGGRAHTQGLELELKWSVTDNVLVALSGNVQQARFDDAVPGTPIMEGDRIYNTPDNAFSAIVDWQFSPQRMLTPFVRLEAAYTGSIVEIDQSRELPSYTTMNLRAGVRSDRWDATFYVDNVTDENAELGFSTLTQDVYTNQPQKIGLSLRFRY